MNSAAYVKRKTPHGSSLEPRRAFTYAASSHFYSWKDINRRTRCVAIQGDLRHNYAA